MRFTRGDVRDHIVLHKNYHGLSYRALESFAAVEPIKNQLSRDFRSRSGFDVCNSIGAKRTSQSRESMSALWV
jgi:hypothetical protein